MFQKTRLQLTAWYLLIIMAISLLFSLAIYSGVNREFRKFEHMQVRILAEGDMPPTKLLPPPTGKKFFFKRLDPQEIQAARTRVIVTLGLINLIILGAAGAAGYFLAGRTLQPIQDMVDEQKRFITDASHELRTPITSLRSEIEVALRKNNLTLADTQKLLQSNLEEVINLQQLSDHLLELSQLGKPLIGQNKTEVLIKECMQVALKNLNGLIKKKHITIKEQMTDIIVYGVPEKLTELFVILLDNAIKYAPPKSSLSIRIQQKDGKALIQITDHGTGIAADDLPHVFERFYRGSKSRSKDNVAGHGLGLAIAKEIVNFHNGSIDIKSKPGKGTVVTVAFSAIFKD